MLGALIGDIVGSRFEWHNHRNKDFKLFTEYNKFTDDTVMTLAIGKAILECQGNYTDLGKKTINAMLSLGRKYPDRGYGGKFRRWLTSDNPQPYNSLGNGAGMRVSPCAWVAQSEAEAKELSKKVTEVTHNHPEGIKGAEAITMAIYFALHGKDKDFIANYTREHYYPDLNFTIAEIRSTYNFDATCPGSVPQAIEAFLEGLDFEDTIRLAISLGGDSDTIAAMAGAIAQPYFGIPKDIEEKALTYLEEDLRRIVSDWLAKYPVLTFPKK